MLANLVYIAALLCASPWIAYRAIRHGRYRRGIRQKLFGLSRRDAKKLSKAKDCIWVHAVSVGEIGLIEGVGIMLNRMMAEVPEKDWGGRSLEEISPMSFPVVDHLETVAAE